MINSKLLMMCPPRLWKWLLKKKYVFKNKSKCFHKKLNKISSFLVSEKSPKTRKMCGRDQNCAQTFLQPKTY